MTTDEIKQTKTMREVVESYGIEIRRDGMCVCPFHDDRHPSMKVYKDSYYCFTCHEAGDVFTFVQKMDNVDFKTAFISLGGTYEALKPRTAIGAKIKRQTARNERDRVAKSRNDFFKTLTGVIHICRTASTIYKPFEDGWCYANSKLQYLLYCYEMKFIKEEEINELDVYRECREIKCRLLC